MLSKQKTTRVSLQTGCKINLFLRVCGRLPNGYHTLETLFLPLAEPHDRLEIAVLNDSSATGLCTRFYHQAEEENSPATPLRGIDPDNNTLSKAYRLYHEATGYAPALDVAVYKGIPHGAGLGGGSADAAVLLRFLQQEAARSGKPDTAEGKLASIAAAVGADVPFFLFNKPAFASGIGEILVPASPPFTRMWCVLVCPPLHISTPWAFAELDRLRGLTEKNVDKNNRQDLTSTAHQATYSLAHGEQLVNDLEEGIFKQYPELARIHQRLEALGAKAARMSGSGSSLFGLFDSEQNAQQAAKTLAKDELTVYMQRLP